MKNEFRILKNLKEFILSLDDVIILFPKSEKVLKDKIKLTSFEAFECLNLANIKNDKLNYQQELIVKLSLLDFYFEIALKKHYLSIKQCEKICNKLSVISKMVYGWIKNEK